MQSYELKTAALKRALEVVQRRAGVAVRCPWWALPVRLVAAVLWVPGMALHLCGLLLITVSDELREAVHLNRYRRAVCGAEK